MGDYAELTYLKAADVREYLASALPAYGYTSRTLPSLPKEPYDEAGLKTNPQALVFVTVGGGPGLSKDGAFDRVFITVRTVSRQRDLEGGERLALAVDRALLALGDSGMLGSVYALGITRTGGAPTWLRRDSAERHHFPCSYVTETETGL